MGFLVNEVVPFLNLYLVPLTILGTMILGNAFILTISALVARGAFDFWRVLFLVFLGVSLSDVVWFYIARTKLIEKMHLKLKKTSNVYAELKETISRTHTSTIRSNLLILFLSKYIYGVETLVVFYFSKRGMPLWKFLLYNMPNTFVWVSTLVTAGWLAGKGYTKLLEVYDNFRIVLTVILAILLILYFTWRLASKRLLSIKEKKASRNRKLSN